MDNLFLALIPMVLLLGIFLFAFATYAIGMIAYAWITGGDIKVTIAAIKAEL